MKKLLWLLMSIGTFAVSRGQRFALVTPGKANSKIIVPAKPTMVEVQAAKVLQDYIQRISGVTLSIIPDDMPPSANEILIGKVNRPELKNIQFDKLLKDGLLIRSNGKKLLIAGGSGKGVLYGVYTFLEKYLGCKKYSSSVGFVPTLKTIAIPTIDDMQLPGFDYREDFFPDAYNQEYLDWHKLDTHLTSSENGNEWASWVHTFDNLLSTKEYGQSHPEYFSFYNGTRHAGLTTSGQPEAQLCLSNPEVLEIVCKQLKSQMEKNPTALYWSVSQNDNVNYCRDSLCAALDKKYAAYSPEQKTYLTNRGQYVALGMGSMLNFVNKVAERFPDKIISTAAYQYTRVPPKDILPRKNVNIMLCSIESRRDIPIEKGDTAFASDLTGWSKLTSNIIIWDYVVQFRNLLSPFPNLRTLQPNLQHFHDKGVQAIFEEGNPETGGEFAELRTYLIAKLLWNPSANVDSLMNDFLKGYYGKASAMIGSYINILHNKIEKSGERLRLYATPPEEKDSFLSDSLINVYNTLFDEAENAVSGSPDLFYRVKTARLPIYYATLEIARSEQTGKRGAFINGDNNSLLPNPNIIKLLYDFVYGCVRSNVSHISEGRTTARQYLEGYNKFLQENSRAAGTSAVMK